MDRKFSIHKAALLVASLDADTADLLLAQMSQADADAVRNEVMRLGDHDPDEQQAVIEEFCQFGPMPPEPEAIGRESAVSPFPRTFPNDDCEDEATGSDEARRPAEMYSDSDRTEQQPFSFLQSAEPELLVPFLEREHPQAVALLLAHLPHEQAGHILARLPAATQTEVIRRLVDLQETDPHVLQDLETAVRQWLARHQSGSRRTAGMAAVEAILNASDRTARRQILNNLAVHDRPLAHRLTPSPPIRHFTFAEVCRFPTDALASLIRAADRRTVILAFAGAPAHIVEPFLDEIEPEESFWISHGLQHLGPLRVADFDRAQESFAELADQMYAQGKLPGLGAQHVTALA